MLKNAQMEKDAVLLEKMIESGQSGMSAGHGFYRYPDPAYLRPEFLSGTTSHGQSTGQAVPPGRPFGMAVGTTTVPPQPPSQGPSVDLAPRRILRRVQVAAPIHPRLMPQPTWHGGIVVAGFSSLAFALEKTTGPGWRAASIRDPVFAGSPRAKRVPTCPTLSASDLVRRRGMAVPFVGRVSRG